MPHYAVPTTRPPHAHEACCPRSELESQLRLVLHSFLEDGAYARELYATISDRVIPLFVLEPLNG